MNSNNPPAGDDGLGALVMLLVYVVLLAFVKFREKELRFSTRNLLIVTTLAAVWLGFIASALR